MDEPREFWFWTVTDPLTHKRRQLAYRMTEDVARQRFGDDAIKVEGTGELRTPAGSTSEFLRRRD